MTDTELLDGLYGEVGTWTDVIILTIEHTTWHHQHGTLELSLELTSSVYYVYTEVDCAMVMIHNKDGKLLHQTDNNNHTTSRLELDSAVVYVTKY